MSGSATDPMTTASANGARARRPYFGLRLMRGRNPAEHHRAATPLELLFDLVFVVAVSFASQNLHHTLSEGHVGTGTLLYLMAFFGIWWAWMNFTWFATSYDTDDWLYRITTILQMGGVLVFAAGIPSMTNPEHPDFSLTIIGYTIMRVAVVGQWVRAAISDKAARSTALRYACGILLVQALWFSLLIIPSNFAVPVFFFAAVCEMLVPVIGGHIPWHAHHVTERYGLFTLIVLGESVLASTNAFVAAANERDHLGSLVLIAVTALVIIACFWWLYFALPQHGIVTSFRVALGWGYSHYLIFASAAALSVGVEIAINLDAGESHLTPIVAAACLTVPCAVYVLMVWFTIVRKQESGAVNVLVPAVAVAIGFSAFLPYSMQATALLMILAVALVTGGRPKTELEASHNTEPVRP